MMRTPIATPPLRLSLALGMLAALALLATAPGIPIVWDEGEYLWRSDLVRAWLALWIHPADPQGGWHALSDAAILQHWKFVIWEEGHPAAAAIPMALGSSLLGAFFHPLTAARAGTMAIVGLACGVISYRLRALYGTVAAIGAVAAILTFPRLFSEAHFATLDAQLTAWWLILWALDASPAIGVAAATRVGLAAGLTAAVKFPGWVAWGPLILTRTFLRGAGARRSLLLILPIGLLTFVLVNPPLWHHPISRFVTHVQLNTHRTLDIPVAFLGHIYQLRNGLPWYNTIAWLLMVTPLPTLVLGSLGLVRLVRTRDAVSVSLLLSWASLMIVRALPGTPPHDGIRLFLPAFGFWCLFAGIGAQLVWDAATPPADTTARAWRRAPLLRTALVASLLLNIVTVGRYYPQTLSHYNALVGGVRGAAALGMEPAYWWDALDSEVLVWINQHTDTGARVAFSAIANVSMIRGWHLLTPPAAERREGPFQWYVLQNRTGFLAPSDRWLMTHERPAFTKYAGRDSTRDPGPDMRVPLILIYSYDQYQTALSAAHAAR